MDTVGHIIVCTLDWMKDGINNPFVRTKIFTMRHASSMKEVKKTGFILSIRNVDRSIITFFYAFRGFGDFAIDVSHHGKNIESYVK